MRGRLTPAPLVIGVEQGVQHMVARRQGAGFVAPLEGAHHRQSQEDLGEDIVIGRRGRGLGVVFGEVEALAQVFDRGRLRLG